MSTPYTRPQPVVGAILPQRGPTKGAALGIDGVTFWPQELGWETPLRKGRFYQGKPTLILRWDTQELDSFQALSVIFFGKLNIPPGPIVSVVWPDPYTAGRFEEAKAEMVYPTWSWRDLYMRTIEVRLERFGLRPEEIAAMGG